MSEERKQPMSDRSVPFVRDLRAGYPFYFSGGAYSDYNVLGFFLPLVDISAQSLSDMIRAFKFEIEKEEEANGWIDGDTRERFIAEMIRQGLLMALTAPEVHLGDSSYSAPELTYEKTKEERGY